MYLLFVNLISSGLSLEKWNKTNFKSYFIVFVKNIAVWGRNHTAKLCIGVFSLPDTNYHIWQCQHLYFVTGWTEFKNELMWSSCSLLSVKIVPNNILSVSIIKERNTKKMIMLFLWILTSCKLVHLNSEDREHVSLKH